MKAIIFDLDNTLIMWKDEFISALKNVLKEMNYNFSEELITKIDESINMSEKYYPKLSKETFLEFVNHRTNLNLPILFVDKLIEAQGNLFYQDEELKNTLEYLSKKYDLYVITNWFTETQKKRLENMGILQYFQKVYGADINYYKPNPQAFAVIFEKYQPNECLSIGDSLENDVEFPISLGMHAIWKTDKKDHRYQTIKSLNELKNIL